MKIRSALRGGGCRSAGQWGGSGLEIRLKLRRYLLQLGRFGRHIVMRTEQNAKNKAYSTIKICILHGPRYR